MRRILTLVGALALGITQYTLPVLSQEFPKKQPIKIILPVGPGAGTDALARISAEFLQRRLGQSVVVENRPGASGAIATDYVAKAPADGYTLLFTGLEFAVLPAVRSNLPYNFQDFTFLARAFNGQPLLLASPKLPVSSIQELVAYMKANPGKVRYGTTGVGAIVHLGMAMIESSAGVKGVHVPYTGTAALFPDLLSGNVDLTQASYPFPDGIKVLGSVGSKRHPAAPNALTLDEAGIKNASWQLWYGVMGPPKLPKPIADRLIEEWTAVLKDPEALAKFAAINWVPDPVFGDEFKKIVVDENKRWKEVVEREKIVVQH
jgi:tripartite-type tricarboxylate transporter receptor subunit TctC